MIVAGLAVDAGHARQLGVLAVLLAEANQVVPNDQLLERVWGRDRAPANPRGAVRTYVSLLRRVLTGAEDVAIMRQASGYRLVVDTESVDLHRFRSLLGEASATPDDDHAATLMQRALALWRGEPFMGLDTPWISDIRQVLMLERQAARLDLTDLQLRRGRHAAVLADLNSQAAERPLDERVAGQLMLALYFSGRQAEALDHYQRVRRQLAEDLGADPGGELRLLHQRILAADPALAVAAAPIVAVRPATVPRQLPAEPLMFTGRSRELALITATLDWRTARGGPLAIAVIGGMGGVGKSWLALCWARRHIDRFPDGQLWVDLRGFDPAEEPTPPAVALRGFLSALGVDTAAMPVGLDAQIGLYRSLTADRRMLIVLDNARDTAQVVPLLPGSSSCAVLVTSRRSLGGLVTGHGAGSLDLDVLSEHDARQLLADQLGAARVAAEPEAVAELLGYCAGLPLALSITIARAAAQPQLPLAVLAAELRDHAFRLDALNAGEPQADLRTVLSWSCRALSGAAARAFALLGIAPGPTIALPAAAGLLGLPVAVTRTLLSELEHAHLLYRSSADRYRMHDLVRLRACEQARDDCTPADRQEALRRVVDFYLHAADAAGRLLTPDRPAIAADAPAAEPAAEGMPDTAAALAWFDAEHACLLATQRLALSHGWDAQVCLLARALAPYHRRRGRVQDQVAVWQLALIAARRVCDPTVRTRTHQHLGDAYVLVGRTAEGLDQLRQALAFAEQAHDIAGEGHVHHSLGGAWERHGDVVQALRHARQALRIFQTLGNAFLEARALNAVGWLQARLGRYAEARADCEAALALLGRLPAADRQVGESHTLDSLGYIARHLHEYDEALGYYDQALAVCREQGNVFLEADVLDAVAETHLAQRRLDDAHGAWKQALELYHAQHRLDDAERVTRRLADT